VEPVSLTLGLATAQLIAKSVDRATTAAVDAGAKALVKLATWVQAKLGGEPDSPLARVQQEPGSPTLQRDLAKQIDERAGADPDFAAELHKLVDEAETQLTIQGDVTQTAQGNANVQIGNASGSTISTNIGASSPDTRWREIGHD
jgi:hypothetical protein